MSASKKTVLIVLSFFAIYFIWGSTYLLNKITVAELPPFFLASIRFLVSGVFIFIIAKLMGIQLAITRKQLINALVSGFLFLVYGNGVFVWALKYVESGLGALIASTQPLFVLLLMRAIDGKKIKIQSLIGIILGLIGMYVLVSQNEFLSNESSLVGIVMILTCVLSWSFASVFVSKATLPVNYFVSTGYQMTSAGLLLMLASLGFNETWIYPTQWSNDVIWSMLLLVLFGGIVAFTAFNYLLKMVSTEKVTTSAYVNPVIAMFLGWYILDEKLSAQSIIAALILLTGVYFITTKRKMKIRFMGR